MAPDKQTADLVDVIYRDPNRVPSLYAQLFGGHLVNFERTSDERASTEATTGTGFNLALLKGDAGGKDASEASRGTKETLQPHNSDALDVVSAILGRGQLHGGYKQAANGAVIRVKGTLYFFDSDILRAVSAASADTTAKGAGGKEERRKKRVMEHLKIPSLYFLVDGESIVAGTFHEAGLSDPINSFLFKHGDNGLPDVTLVGFKEVSRPFTTKPQQALDAGRGIARGLRGLFLADDMIRVSPICIYRTLG